MSHESRIAMKPKSIGQQHPPTVLMKSTSAWNGLAFSHVAALPIPFMRRGASEVPWLGLTVAGSSELKWSVGADDFQALVCAGTVTYMDHDYELEKLSSSGELKGFVLELDTQEIEQWTGRDPSAGALLSRHMPRHVIDADPHIDALMRGMEAEILNGCPSGRLYAESISLAVVSYLWGKFSRRHSTRELNGLSSASLVVLKEYIRANVSYDVSLAQMASITRLSPKHLCRCFKQATGKSPYQYLLQLRMDEAKRLLRNGNPSITEVAFSTGFSNPSHFSTAFRKAVGLSPSQFRKRL